jgi:hypothetical protein
MAKKGSGDVLTSKIPKAGKGYGEQVAPGGKKSGRGMQQLKPIDPKSYTSAAERADKRK